MKQQETAAVEYPFAVKAGVAAAALLSIWGVLDFASVESTFQKNADPYKIGAQVSRFEGLRAAVPANAIVGYLSDLSAGDPADEGMFNSARFVLAPRLIERNQQHDLVIGNFTKPEDFAALGCAKGLSIVRDFGDGVVLFRKDAK